MVGGANHHHPVNSPSGLRDILLSSASSLSSPSMLPRRDHHRVAKEVEVEVEVVEEEDGRRSRSRGIVLPAAAAADVIVDDDDGCDGGGSSSSSPASYNSVLGRIRRPPPRHLRVDGGGPYDARKTQCGDEDGDGIDRSNDGGGAVVFGGGGVGAMMTTMPKTTNDAATASVASFATAWSAMPPDNNQHYRSWGLSLSNEGIKLNHYQSWRPLGWCEFGCY